MCGVCVITRTMSQRSSPLPSTAMIRSIVVSYGQQRPVSIAMAALELSWLPLGCYSRLLLGCSGLFDRQHEHHHEFFHTIDFVGEAQRSKERYDTCDRKSPVIDPVHCLDNQRIDFNSLFALVSTHERIKHLRPSTLPIDAEKSLIVSIPSTSPA